jgi:hypothetical protein
MIRAARIDTNHKEIVDKLRCIPNVSVRSVAQLKGFCDIIVGYRGRNYLFEIKKDGKSKLTDKEKIFQDTWHGQVLTIYNIDDILKLIL